MTCRRGLVRPRPGCLHQRHCSCRCRHRPRYPCPRLSPALPEPPSLRRERSSTPPWGGRLARGGTCAIHSCGAGRDRRLHCELLPRRGAFRARGTTGREREAEAARDDQDGDAEGGKPGAKRGSEAEPRTGEHADQTSPAVRAERGGLVLGQPEIAVADGRRELGQCGSDRPEVVVERGALGTGRNQRRRGFKVMPCRITGCMGGDQLEVVSRMVVGIGVAGHLDPLTILVARWFPQRGRRRARRIARGVGGDRPEAVHRGVVGIGVAGHQPSSPRNSPIEPASRSRSASRPRWIRDFTVPSDTPVISAISE